MTQNDETKEAFLLTLTDEQLEKIQNDDFAAIETAENLFHIVHQDHADEAVQSAEDVDGLEVVKHEVERRG